MRAENIRAQRKKKRKRTTDSQHNYPIAPNLLNRNFQAEVSKQKWMGDIIFISTAAKIDIFAYFEDFNNRMRRH